MNTFDREGGWRRRHIRTVLGISTMLMGACGIVYEYTLGALGNNLMGSSHEQLFVIIGLMLFAMGVGSALQRKAARDLIDKFLLLELFLGLIGGISVLLIYLVFVYTAAYTVVMYAFALAIGGCIGLEIPLLIRISNGFAGSLRSSLSDILSLDYLGALAGALVFTYVLLTRVSMERITLLLGAINTVIGLFGVAFFWPMVKRPRTLAAIGGVILVGLATAATLSPTWMGALEQRCYRDPIVYAHTSVYQHIVLTKRDDRVNLHINGHLQFSATDERIYHELLVHPPMAAAASIDRVLILGGGDGLALREVLKYPTVTAVDLVDLDPAMTELAATHPEMVRLNEGAFYDARVRAREAEGIAPGRKMRLDAPAVRSRSPDTPDRIPIAEVQVHNIDADLFVRQLGGPYQVAIIDFPDPSSIELAKLYSVGFFRNLARLLSPGAVLSIQATSPFHAQKVFLCIGRTLEEAGFEVLPYHENVPSFGEWGWYLAWKKGVSKEAVMKKLKETAVLPVATSFLTPKLLSSVFVFGKGWLRFETVAFNTKMKPVILDYFRQSWSG